MRCYLVGGAVRDRLLGRDAADRDWLVVDETHASLVARGFKPVGQLFTTYLHPRTGEQYSLPRGTLGDSASELDVVIADLSARDLTINALAISPEQQFVDPFNGRADVSAGVLRHISSAFADDPVRVMRVVRLAAVLGFEVAPVTALLCQNLSACDCFLPAHRHRLFTEFVRAACGPHTAACVAAMDRTGILGWLQGTGRSDSPDARASMRAHLELTLHTARREHVSEHGVFAAASFVLGSDSVCEKLAPPTACLRAARAFTRHHAACSAPRSVEPRAIVALFEDTRALRDDANLSVLIEAACAIAGGDNDTPKHASMWADIKAALDAARSVDSAQFADSRSGPALGAALRSARAQAIAIALQR